jgi:hypothetical protein
VQETGQQNSKVDTTIPVGFLRRTRIPQSVFKAKQLNLPFDIYAKYMIIKDREKSKNQYDGLGFFGTDKKYHEYNKPFYSYLRSNKDIAINIFNTLGRENIYCKNIVDDIVKSDLISTDKIEIEFALKPKVKYLNTGTSFDANIGYTNYDGLTGQFYRNIIQTLP